VPGGAYISAHEQTPPFLALLAPISPSKAIIISVNEHEKRYNFLNFAFIKTKFAQLIEKIYPVRINLVRYQLDPKRERYGHISL
jgi:hypothetical protein